MSIVVILRLMGLVYSIFSRNWFTETILRLRGAKFYDQSELFSVDQIFKSGQTPENDLFFRNYFTAKQTHNKFCYLW